MGRQHVQNRTDAEQPPGPDTRAAELIELVDKAVDRAERFITTLPPAVLRLNGMSARKNRILLNELCTRAGTRYLEIGCWHGATLISALHGNRHTVEAAAACDNFTTFGGPREAFRANVRRFLPDYQGLLSFFDMDCWQAARHLSGAAFNLYFYDGEHGLEDQYNAFASFNHVLAEVFIAVVDDFNHAPARQGTRKAFADLGYSTLHERVLPARWNGDEENWWNGLFVAVVSK